MDNLNAKDKIIETSIEMIEKEGYNNITTNHIAKKAGVSIGTLYYHFENGKIDIIKEIIRRDYMNFIENPKLKNLKIENLLEFLKLFLAQYLKDHRKQESFILAFESAFLSNRQVFKDYLYIQDDLNFVPFISNLLNQLGYTKKKNLDQISSFLLFAIDSIVHRHIIYGKEMFEDKEIVEYLSEMIFKFIKSEA